MSIWSNDIWAQRARAGDELAKAVVCAREKMAQEWLLKVKENFQANSKVWQVLFGDKL